MEWYQILLFLGALGIMLLGLAGTVLPVLPGIPLICVTFWGYDALTGGGLLSDRAITALVVIAIASFVLDYALAWAGARRFGAGNAGVIGSLVGMMVAAIVPGLGWLGILAGAFLGACLFEVVLGKNPGLAVKAGFGGLLGLLAGGLLKLVIGVALVGYFVWTVVTT